LLRSSFGRIGVGATSTQKTTDRRPCKGVPSDTGDISPNVGKPAKSPGENEGLSQTDLVERTGVDRSTLADIVKRLIRKGLLQRRRTKEDARAYAVKLTEEGQRVLRTAEPLAKRMDQRILDALPAKQRAQFMGALASIVSTLERTAPAVT
jgi:MarR family transcriptional regulator, temperature-dependent positive regulator of motility